jgi:Response regulators consisting of a CheY-like receiver domain and a winged-helix DNA-binding domain
MPGLNELEVRKMEQKILIAEDDGDINGFITDALTKSGYACTSAFSGTEALIYIKNEMFDVILLDLMLPGLSGDRLIRQIKPHNNTPIIVVTAKDELDSKVDLLMLGADDYITKPFEIEELLARVAVQIRKSNRGSTKEILKHQNLVLDKETHKVNLHNHDVILTRQEFKILELLLTYPNKVFSKQDIYDYAWDDAYIGEDKTINVHISNIRQKLKQISPEEYIETVWGVGFKLAD